MAASPHWRTLALCHGAWAPLAPGRVNRSEETIRSQERLFPCCCRAYGGIGPTGRGLGWQTVSLVQVLASGSWPRVSSRRHEEAHAQASHYHLNMRIFLLMRQFLVIWNILFRKTRLSELNISCTGLLGDLISFSTDRVLFFHRNRNLCIGGINEVHFLLYLLIINAL